MLRILALTSCLRACVVDAKPVILDVRSETESSSGSFSSSFAAREVRHYIYSTTGTLCEIVPTLAGYSAEEERTEITELFVVANIEHNGVQGALRQVCTVTRSGLRKCVTVPISGTLLNCVRVRVRVRLLCVSVERTGMRLSGCLPSSPPLCRARSRGNRS